MEIWHILAHFPLEPHLLLRWDITNGTLLQREINRLSKLSLIKDISDQTQNSKQVNAEAY